MPLLIVTYDASGAFWAAKQGLVVVVVDVISMSTTLESMLAGGAIEVLGAAPSNVFPPVTVAPERVGYAAGQTAVKYGTGVVVVGEPRAGSRDDMVESSRRVLRGIGRAGARVEAVVPNLGADTAGLAEVDGRVVVAVTASGGVCYDTAFNAGAPVITGTVARVGALKGAEPGRQAAKRAVDTAFRTRSPGIAVVAASSRAKEDVLAANLIAEYILDLGYTEGTS